MRHAKRVHNSVSGVFTDDPTTTGGIVNFLGGRGFGPICSVDHEDYCRLVNSGYGIAAFAVLLQRIRYPAPLQSSN
jgi:hypothetical protein